MAKVDNLPLIFDLHRSSLDDGPGIRTVVYMKGCPLSCVWCHNPESQSAEPELAFYPELCIGCGECQKVCPHSAIDLMAKSRVLRDRCRRCGRCADECYALALQKIGEEISVAQLVQLLLKDRTFYQRSGGGVTFSGGEPLMHIDYLSEAMQQLKGEGIHLAIETCGFFDLAAWQEKILPYTDLVLYDLKLFDSAEHQRYTGQKNDLILANFRHIVRERGVKVIPRIPQIPGVTDTSKNMEQIIRFLKENGCCEYHVLPFNPGGYAKSLKLGKECPADAVPEFFEKYK